LFCENPVSRKLTIKQVKAFLLGYTRKLLRLAPESDDPAAEAVVDRTYQKPALRQITLDQAKLILIGRATLGDQGARDLMEVVFLDPRTKHRGVLPGAAASVYPSELFGRSPAPDCP
jgi:hypothetical protein